MMQEAGQDAEALVTPRYWNKLRSDWDKGDDKPQDGSRVAGALVPPNATIPRGSPYYEVLGGFSHNGRCSVNHGGGKGVEAWREGLLYDGDFLLDIQRDEDVVKALGVKLMQIEESPMLLLMALSWHY